LPATWVILPESFNDQNYLMNSTMKIVRGKIVDYFAKELKFLYTAESKHIFNEFNMKALDKWNKG
jgi:long-chain acyl-CoA synthetase